MAEESTEVLMGCQKRLTQYLWDFLRKEYTSPSLLFFFANKDLSFATLYTTVIFIIDLSILKSIVTAHMCCNPTMYAI